MADAEPHYHQPDSQVQLCAYSQWFLPEIFGVVCIVNVAHTVFYMVAE